MRAVLSEVAQEQDSRWGKLHDRLRHAGAKNSVAVGAAADHECAARHEAALSLSPTMGGSCVTSRAMMARLRRSSSTLTAFTANKMTSSPSYTRWPAA